MRNLSFELETAKNCPQKVTNSTLMVRRMALERGEDVESSVSVNKTVSESFLNMFIFSMIFTC